MQLKQLQSRPQRTQRAETKNPVLLRHAGDDGSFCSYFHLFTTRSQKLSLTRPHDTYAQGAEAYRASAPLRSDNLTFQMPDDMTPDHITQNTRHARIVQLVTKQFDQKPGSHSRQSCVEHSVTKNVPGEIKAQEPQRLTLHAVHCKRVRRDDRILPSVKLKREPGLIRCYDEIDAGQNSLLTGSQTHSEAELMNFEQLHLSTIDHPTLKIQIARQHVPTNKE